MDRIGPSGPARPTSTPGSRVPHPVSPDRAIDEPRDRIDLSPEARDLAAASTPEERDAVVQRLREQVQDGTYRVDADAVAEHMVEFGDV